MSAMRSYSLALRRLLAAMLAPAPLRACLAVCCALSFGLGAGIAHADDAAPKDTVRAEVGKPLQAAQTMIKEHKFKEALAAIKEAEAVAGRTPYENFIIDQLRGAAAASDGQDALAVSSYESVVGSGRMPAADQLKIELAIAVTYYNKLKDYPNAAKWAARYIKEGGTDAAAQDLIINSYYLSGDYAQAVAALKAVMELDEKAGHPSSEQRLLLLLSCAVKQKDSAGEAAALEKLLAAYPKKEYWDQAISHLEHRPGFAERLDLDLLRIRFALHDLKRESDFMDMGQLALEAGFPVEAKRAVDQGFTSGVLGKGADAERHKRLQTLINKEAAEDQKMIGAGDVDAEKSRTGDGLLNAGFNYVLNGKFEKGLALMEQGLKKGGLKHPEDAKLHMGVALVMAGERERAVQVLRTVSGNDGAAELAHLWAVYVAR